MVITNGKIIYSRTVRPADYEGKTGTVELSFTLDEGEDYKAAMAEVSLAAKERALAMVDIAPKRATDMPKSDDLGGGSKGPSKEVAAAALNAADEKAAKAAAKAAKAAEAAEAAATAAKAAEATKTITAQVDDDLGEFNEDAAESQPEITDAELSTAMNKKVAELKPKHAGAAPKLIKELINTFVEPPKKSHDIPQAQRSLFLKKLAELK